jgi:hypothetical protein
MGEFLYCREMRLIGLIRVFRLGLLVFGRKLGSWCSQVDRFLTDLRSVRNDTIKTAAERMWRVWAFVLAI